MKNKVIYILAFFLIFSGSFFGYMMQKQNKKQTTKLPVLPMAEVKTKPEITPVVTEEVSVPVFLVQSVGGEILILQNPGEREVCRISFLEERLYDEERKLLAKGISAQTKEEALMIAEAFIN